MTEGLDFNEADIEVMLANLDAFSVEEVAEIDRMVDELHTRSTNKRAYDDLIEFCKLMMPDFIVGKHHRILANMLMGIEKGDKEHSRRARTMAEDVVEACIEYGLRFHYPALVTRYFEKGD